MQGQQDVQILVVLVEATEENNNLFGVVDRILDDLALKRERCKVVAAHGS